MNRFFKAAVCLILLAACTTVQIIRPERPDLAHSVSSLVEVGISGNPYATGSAVHVAPGVFLTARHVVELPNWVDPEAGEVTVHGFLVDQIHYLGDRDAALLFIQPLPDVPLPRVWCVDPDPLTVGDDIWVSGFGLGEHWMAYGLATVDPERLGVEVSPGDSGCPYIDTKGCVRGIIVAKDRRAPNHTFTEPMCYLVPLIPEDVQAQMSCGCFETE